MTPADSVTVTVEVDVDPATAFEVFTDEIDTVWEPGVRLVYADLVSGVAPHLPTEVEVRFEPFDGGTRVSLQHRGLNQLPPDMAEQKREHGWKSLAHWYADYLNQQKRG